MRSLKRTSLDSLPAIDKFNALDFYSDIRKTSYVNTTERRMGTWNGGHGTAKYRGNIGRLGWVWCGGGWGWNSRVLSRRGLKRGKQRDRDLREGAA